ncbi:MAG: autoinducer binding domain-containing protein [Pararhodobacter sp.]|nr:autoinducer binding domain-containing protein [Pararhodobacter sp.]
MTAGPEPALAEIAEATLRGSGMDSIGLYRLDDRGRMEGVILGMPDAFVRAYETQGMPIDPVLSRVRQTGAPTSTLVTLGRRWTSCHLYQRVSGRFGLTGFATFPLYDEDRLTGMLYLGAMNGANAQRLDHEGLCAMTPHAIRVATRLLRLPAPVPALSPRQAQVAALAGQGLTNGQIAQALGTGEAAVHKHMKALHRVFGTHTRAALAAAWLSARHH